MQNNYGACLKMNAFDHRAEQAQDRGRKAPADLKGDRRSRRTAITLQKSLVDLLLEKPLSDISIQELTENANISRTTFYLHYRNIAELFESMEDAVVAQYQEIINKSLHDDNYFLNFATDSQGRRWIPTLYEAFQFFYDNPKFCTVLFKNPDSNFFQRTVERGHDAVLDRMASLRPDLSRTELEYFFYFVMSGIRGMIQRWLNCGYRESPRQIAGIVSQYVLNHMDMLCAENEKEAAERTMRITSGEQGKQRSEKTVNEKPSR